MKLKISEKGQALVEFAIILPILLLLLGPMVDLGRAIHNKSKLQNITSDMLRLAIMQKEYAFQSTFYAIEDAFLKDDIDNYEYDKDIDREKYEGYLLSKMFDKFIKADNLNDYIDTNNIGQYIEISPIKKKYEHQGKYPKLLKRIPNPTSVEDLEYDHSGYDIAGYDRDGYNDGNRDFNNFKAGTFEAGYYKHEKWKVEGIETNKNFTEYRIIKVKVPYEMKNITLMGRAIFGDSRTLSSESSGIIFLGGDGRHVKDY